MIDIGIPPAKEEGVREILDKVRGRFLGECEPLESESYELTEELRDSISTRSFRQSERCAPVRSPVHIYCSLVLPLLLTLNT